ncbi:alpha/beta fold hydrolase [Leifsonia sp. YAF41]|uniref:alpha/beta fold hydrolase n=1 Tax=Leifsonia sp. YAF41 TaxID=3233086 RepID=UPI003F977B92
MEKNRNLLSVRLATGVTLPYLAQGDANGTPLVLLHAWGESLGSFDRLTPLLRAGIRVFAPDQRGHGEADKPATGYALAQFTADVVAFLDELGLTRAVLLGSSSGGYVAQQVAIDHPERVAGLILVGSPRTLKGRPAFAAEVEKLTDPIDLGWVRATLGWFPLVGDVPEWFVDDRVVDGVRMPARVWIEALRGLYSAEPPTEIGTITAPTLILWAAADGLLSEVDERALAAAIPASRLIVYENTGHLVLWERPDRVAADVTDFLLTLR